MIEIITRTAGIDTGKDRLDVAVHGGDGPFTVDNTPTGWHSLTAALAKAGVRRIEATGGYERGAARHLQGAGFTVVVLQPLQVRAFAACARKLLIFANTVVARGTPWTEKPIAA